jgi:hypothetical protein
MERINRMTIEQVLAKKGENLNIQYVIRSLPLSEMKRTQIWEGIEYDNFEMWFYANCV